MELLAALDPLLSPALKAEWERRRDQPFEPLPRNVTVALVGHRAAGKSALLPRVAELLGRFAVDLDAELALRTGRELKEWVETDEAGFRLAERACFESLQPGIVVACGGGFLAAHPDALKSSVAVIAPITFETYRARLLADPSRPRLRPELLPEQELYEVFQEREERHRRVRVLSPVELLLAARHPLRARRVVTLPPGVNPRDYAFHARRDGAELLEVRTDLIAPEAELTGAARVLPLVVAHRGPPIPPAWRALAELVDLPLVDGAEAELAPAPPPPTGFAKATTAAAAGRRAHRVVSLHAAAPLSPEAAEAAWEKVDRGPLIKHVEPLGEPATGWRLLETQARLRARFGEDRVTVLASGELALPFRAVLARDNALDFLALDARWSAAPGQRLLADAAREARAGMPRRPRLGIVGHGISHSRSPSIHPQPFDRLELPADLELPGYLEALRPHYRGFAVTQPFKLRAIPGRAVNTLARTAQGYEGFNTDTAGAVGALAALGGSTITVLGEGGVAEALISAAVERNASIRFIQQEQAGCAFDGSVVWTWPPDVEPPPALRLDRARVGVISYGAGGRRIADRIRALGGTPVRLGSRWFIAQARAQRQHWEAAV